MSSGFQKPRTKPRTMLWIICLGILISTHLPSDASMRLLKHKHKGQTRVFEQPMRLILLHIYLSIHDPYVSNTKHVHMDGTIYARRLYAWAAKLGMIARNKRMPTNSQTYPSKQMLLINKKTKARPLPTWLQIHEEPKNWRGKIAHKQTHR